MTRRLWLGGSGSASPRPVAVHGCVPLGDERGAASMGRRAMGQVVAGRAATQGSAAPRTDPALTDDLALTLDMATRDLEVTLPVDFEALTVPVDLGTTRPLGFDPKPSRPLAASSPLQPRSKALSRRAGTLPLGVTAQRSRAVRTQATGGASVLAVPPPVTAPVPEHSGAQPAAAAPKVNLFRREAIEALHGTGSAGDRLALPRPSAYGWSILLLVASLTLVIFGGAALAKIEVTVAARGALRAPDGLRAVESTLAGSLTEVLVRAGDEVKSGQVLARLAVAQLEATLASREQELRALIEEDTRAERADRAYAERIARALRERRRVLERRESLNRGLVRQRRDQLERMSASVREGVASVNEELQMRETLQGALEAEQLLRAGLADIVVQLAETDNRLEDRALSRRTELARASAAVAEARALVERSTIRSPSDGRVESLLARPGTVVEAGQLLAQIVPIGAPRSIVAFLPSRETAFVAVGASARVEVESLPVNEFGQALARVARISTDIAEPEELEAQFGERVEGSFVRVELELLPGSESQAMAPHLRSGEVVKVRLHRRERRIISLMFEFARTRFAQ